MEGKRWRPARLNEGFVRLEGPLWQLLVIGNIFIKNLHKLLPVSLEFLQAKNSIIVKHFH